MLDAQRAYLQADQKYTVSKGKELSSLISLFKALGGGWGPLEEGNGSAVKRHQSALTDGGPYEEKGNELMKEFINSLWGKKAGKAAIGILAALFIIGGGVTYMSGMKRNWLPRR